MRKAFATATMLVAAGLLATPASASMHHSRRHHMMMSHNGGHSRHVFYGVGNGGQTPRTTATGGNAGGYSTRN